MKSRQVIPIVVLSFCACRAISAHGQSNAQATQEVSRSVEAVDASVQAEVGGQAPEPSVAEGSHGRAVPLPNAKQSPTTAFWPARAEASVTGTGERTKPVTFGIFSFHPGTQPKAPTAWQGNPFTTSASGFNDDSRHGAELSKATSHSLHGAARPSLSQRATAPTVPASDKTPRLSAPFGRTASVFAGTAVPFRGRDLSNQNGQPAKRRRQQAQESAASGEAK
jgi:hypothetical protein